MSKWDKKYKEKGRKKLIDAQDKDQLGPAICASATNKLSEGKWMQVNNYKKKGRGARWLFNLCIIDQIDAESLSKPAGQQTSYLSM